MYYIYEVFGVKIGCTTDPVRRVEKQQGFSSEEYTILESHIDLHRASERERELQLEKGYRVDNSTYSNTLKMGVLSQTPQAKAKQVKNTDYKRIGIISRERQKGILPKGLHTPEADSKLSKALKGKKKSKDHILKISISKRVKINQYTLEGVFLKQYLGVGVAVKETGITTISMALGQKRQKTAGGYIWKYA